VRNLIEVVWFGVGIEAVWSLLLLRFPTIGPFELAFGMRSKSI
jgi:hypothetical protein